MIETVILKWAETHIELITQRGKKEKRRGKAYVIFMHIKKIRCI